MLSAILDSLAAAFDEADLAAAAAPSAKPAKLIEKPLPEPDGEDAATASADHWDWGIDGTAVLALLDMATGFIGGGDGGVIPVPAEARGNTPGEAARGERERDGGDGGRGGAGATAPLPAFTFVNIDATVRINSGCC